MRRHTSPHNQKTVPVLNQDGAPLAPTRPSRARRWLESGKATKEWRHGHFAVRLTEQYQDPVTPETSLNINPGAKSTGIAIVTWKTLHQGTQEETKEATAVAAFELRHRGDTITRKMLARSSHRRNRRGRLREKASPLPQPDPQGRLASSFPQVQTRQRHHHNAAPEGTISHHQCPD